MKKILLLSASILIAGTSTAATLMLDFGPTTTTAATAKNSPLHAIKPDTGTTWNKVENKSIPSGLRYDDGTPAKDISIYMGKSGYLENLSFKPNSGPTSSVPLGIGANTGVFTGPSAGKDAVFNDPGATATAITGLPAGDYTLYIIGYNTNKAPSASAAMKFWAFPSASTKDQNIKTLIAKPHAVSANNVASSWVEDGNYVKLTVSLTKEKPVLVVMVAGRGEGPDSRGFLNALQITPAK